MQTIGNAVICLLLPIAATLITYSLCGIARELGRAKDEIGTDDYGLHK